MTAVASVSSLVILAVLTLLIGLQRAIEAVFSLDEEIMLQVSRPRALRNDTNAEGADSGHLGAMERRLQHHALSIAATRQLRQAGLRITAVEYYLIRAAALLGAVIVGALITHHIVGAILLGLPAFYLPSFYLNRRRTSRQKAFAGQLDDVITLLIGSLRAGYGLLQALDIIVDEVPPPASEEFRRVIHEVGLGLSLGEALDNLVGRVDSMDLDMMVTAINIQQEVGGNLANVLETISETIRERVRIQGEIRVLTVQQTLTGTVLALLPVIVAGIIFVINPGYMRDLFTPGITLVIPVGAAMGVAIGFVVMRRIVDIKV